MEVLTKYQIALSKTIEKTSLTYQKLEKKKKQSERKKLRS